MARLDIEAHIIIDEATLEAAEDKLLEICNVPGVECLSWRQVDNTPKVIELDDILTTGGAGWLEDHYLTEDGELRQTLTSCAWLRGFVMEDDGCQIERSYLNKKYGKARGLRIWDRKPTDAQRKAVPWDAD